MSASRVQKFRVWLLDRVGSGGSDIEDEKCEEIRKGDDDLGGAPVKLEYLYEAASFL